MKVITSGTFAFALSALAAWGATNAGDAQAASWIRHVGSSCMAQTSSGGWTLASHKLENNTASVQNFQCPIEDNAEHMHDDINNLTVHVYDGHIGDTVQAQGCVSFWGANGGSCGTADNSVAGWDTLTPSLTVLGANPNDFAYLFLRLPNNTGGGTNKMSGFVTYYP
jgi:hypothetical protein